MIEDNLLVRGAAELWEEAVRPPFLRRLEDGTLPAEAFARWLAQDYLFVRSLLSFQSALTAKAPRDCHRVLIQGLAALDRELEWFEAGAARLSIRLDVPPHRTCCRYTDFLLRCAYTEPVAVLLAMLFGVEACYLVGWSALRAAGPYTEFIERWSSAGFRDYVAALAALSARHPHPSAQNYFNQVLIEERDFWTMAVEA